jgi:hypothetical protein
MGKRKFDTCFFERYAKATLQALLGDGYAGLVNEDRPDLQMPDRSLGIEVTRAMKPSKDTAQAMLKEMAGLDVKEMAGADVKEEDREEVDQIIKSGYAYGLQEGRYIGSLEYEYWRLAHPLRRIIESKVSKVGSGFYGNFEEYGLYIFCKDDLTEEEVNLTMEYTSDLQRNLDIKYSKMYLSLIDRLYVCDLTQVDRILKPTTCSKYDISKTLRKEFFLKSI